MLRARGEGRGVYGRAPLSLQRCTSTVYPCRTNQLHFRSLYIVSEISIQPLQSLLRFLRVQLLRDVLGVTFFRIFLPSFYNPETTMIMRFVLRTGVHSLISLLGIELAWRLSWYLQKQLNVKTSDTLLMVVPILTAVSLYGRLMQGRAQSLTVTGV